MGVNIKALTPSNKTENHIQKLQSLPFPCRNSQIVMIANPTRKATIISAKRTTPKILRIFLIRKPSPHSFYIQIHRTAHPSLLDIDPINPHEGIDDRLASIDQERIGKTGGDDLHGHAGFDADAVKLRPRLGRNQESGHMLISVSGFAKKLAVNIIKSCRSCNDFRQEIAC